MANIDKFEDLEVWILARHLTSLVYKVSKGMVAAHDYALRDQMCRAAVSIGANVAEGFGRKTDRDFSSFLYTAKGSAMELVSHLYVALDQGYLAKEEFDKVYSRCRTVISKLVRFIGYLDSHPRKTRFAPAPSSGDRR